jgi:hypothetical protein
MSTGPETTFKNAVNKRLKGKLHNQTTYTPYYSGTPDHWYSGNHDLWIEYKFNGSVPTRTVRSWETLLEPAQYRWMTSRQAEGRNTWVVCGYKNGRNGKGFVLRCPSAYLDKENFENALLTTRQISEQIKQLCDYGYNFRTDDYRPVGGRRSG